MNDWSNTSINGRLVSELRSPALVVLVLMSTFSLHFSIALTAHPSFSNTVYVGLYGYDYWTSSKKVYGLFRARGWTVIINDDLIDRSLSLMQLFIGILSGALGVLFGFICYGPIGAWPSFIIGMICGFIFSGIVLQVISSAVNTIVVCFAEAPNPLQRNHPETFARLVQAWRSAYPNEFTY